MPTDTKSENNPSIKVPEVLAKELKKVSGNKELMPSTYWTKGKMHNAGSTFFEPYAIGDNGLANLRTVNRARYGSINCRTLRNVAQKAWLINVCINHVIKKSKPYFKPATENNKRGFIILKDGEPITGDKGKKKKNEQKIIDFLKNTGSYKDSGRDDFIKYCCKLERDLLTLDQVATEIQYNNAGEPVAFFAVDAATIERVLPDINNPSPITYLQIIDGSPAAGYTDNEMIFDYENPRTDIYHSFYGYSYVEQAIDLITSEINAFVYNSGNFTENKLPRGMLLIDGDASPETVSEMEDYIAEIMSGSPLNQWRIPIIPSGQAKGEGGGIKYVELNGKNRDMEFGAWFDLLNSGVVALFGCSMDELGIQSQKSQNLYERSGNTQINESKSLILGDILSFMESYINKILEKVDPSITMEFVGYEMPDPSKVADLDKNEIESWKTLNEKRDEKGFKKIDQEWADIPLNPQAVQLFQAAQANQQQAGGDMGDGGDDQSWADYGDVQTGEADYGDGTENPEDAENGTEENPEDQEENAGTDEGSEEGTPDEEEEIPEETQKSFIRKSFRI